jgi:hypothetical protein
MGHAAWRPWPFPFTRGGSPNKRRHVCLDGIGAPAKLNRSAVGKP